MTIAIMEFLGLLLYECLVAFLMGAFHEMKPQRKNIYLIFALLPLGLMTMFHGETVGNDTGEYVKFFWRCEYEDYAQILDESRFEKGYVTFVSVCAYLFDNVQSIFIAEGLFLYVALGRWLKKYCKSPGLFSIFMVAALLMDGWMSLQRQALAEGVLFFAFDALVKKKKLKFLVLTLLAAQFHNAAYVFLLAYPAVYFVNSRNEKNNNLLRFNVLAVAGCASALVLTQVLLGVLISFFPVYSYYEGGVYMDGETRIAIVLKIAVYALMLLIPYVLNRRIYLDNYLSQLLYKLSVVNLILVILASQATVLSRLAGVYSMYAFLLYTGCVGRLKYQGNRPIVLVATVLLFALYGVVITVYRTPQWQTTYPFSWCF